MGKIYTVQLYQSHMMRSHTETFQVTAETKEEAELAAKNLVEGDKGITEDYDVVIDDGTEQLPVAEEDGETSGDDQEPTE